MQLKSTTNCTANVAVRNAMFSKKVFCFCFRSCCLFVSVNYREPIIPSLTMQQLLEHFDASTNSIEGPLPLGLGTMYSIQYLDLSHNHITRLPANIGHLRDLFHLNVSYNDFPSFPEALGNLTSLRYFNCSTNKLTQVRHYSERLYFVVVVVVVVVVGSVGIGVWVVCV